MRSVKRRVLLRKKKTPVIKPYPRYNFFSLRMKIQANPLPVATTITRPEKVLADTTLGWRDKTLFQGSIS